MDHPDQPDHPLTLDEAAARLGISREAVRTRLRRGRLAGEQRPDGWIVWSLEPVTVGRTGQDRSDRADHADRDRAELLGQIAWLRAEVERRDQELAQAAVERAELRQLLLAEQTRRLPAPVDVPVERAESANSAPAPAEPVSRVSTPRRVRWAFWRH